MNQKIDQESLARLISLFTEKFINMRINGEGGHIRTTSDNLTILFGNLGPDKIHKIISNNTHDFFAYMSIPFDSSVTKYLALLITENAEQKNIISTLVGKVTEMDADIQTLNEKMAVMTDALSTL